MPRCLWLLAAARLNSGVIRLPFAHVTWPTNSSILSQHAHPFLQVPVAEQTKWVSPRHPKDYFTVMIPQPNKLTAKQVRQYPFQYFHGFSKQAV